jgi:hypothetical protein
MKLTVSLLAVAISAGLLSGCASQPESKKIAVKTIENSDLGYVEAESIDKFVVKNAQAFKQFDKVILFPTQFDKLQLAETTDKKIAQNWNKSTWDEMDLICQHLDDFAEKIFRERDEFEPVKRGGEDVLAIQFSLISFMPYSNRYRDAGLSTVGISTNNAGIGLVTIRGVLANAKTGELVAVIEDTLEVNSRTSTSGNLAAVVDGNSKAAQQQAWRKAFRDFIDSIHQEITTLKYAQIAQHP